MPGAIVPVASADASTAAATAGAPLP